MGGGVRLYTFTVWKCIRTRKHDLTGLTHKKKIKKSLTSKFGIAHPEPLWRDTTVFGGSKEAYVENTQGQMSIMFCTCKSKWLSGFKQKQWWRISRCHSPRSIYITDNHRSYIPGFNLANIIDPARPGPREGKYVTNVGILPFLFCNHGEKKIGLNFPWTSLPLMDLCHVDPGVKLEPNTIQHTTLQK